MGNTKKTSKTRATRAARPAGPPQPSVTPFVGPAPVVGANLAEALSEPHVSAPRSADDPYALVGWGEASGIGGAEDVRCPSGQLALCQRPGIQGLIEAGVLHEMDSLTSLVDQKHLKRVKGGGQEIDAQVLMRDPAKLEEVMAVVERVLVYVVLKPTLTLHWVEKGGKRVALDRDARAEAEEKAGQKLVWTDQVEMDDKMFIFNYAVGGTRNLERFRQLADDAVGSVDAEPNLEGAAE